MSTKIISNTPYTLSVYWKKCIQYKFLILVLAKRELKVKYSRTLLGIGWVLFQPLAVVVVYTIFFQNFIKLNTEEIPYPQFVFSGLVLWYLFTGIISKCAYALIESSELINKVSFPKIIILMSKCIPVIIECLALLVISIIVLLFSNQAIHFSILTSVYYFLQTLLLSFAIGIICSIMVLKFRDLVHAIPFVINFGIWLTPVFYSVSIVPEQYKNILRFVNPLTLAMEGLRGGLFQNRGISFTAAVLGICSCLFLIISFAIFVKFEKRIVENL